MNEQKLDGREERLPSEVVEIYSRPLCREVVEVYERPLPSRFAPLRTETEMPRRRRSRKGLWIFLLVFSLIIAAAAVAWFWNREHGAPKDPFEYVPGERCEKRRRRSPFPPIPTDRA